MNRTMRAESGAKVAKEDVWDQVSAFVGRFGHAAEQYAARFNFGISPEVIRVRMEPILGDAGRACVAGMPCEIARPRSEDVSENGGANRGRVRHPLLFPIPDDTRGHRPGYFDEFLLRVDARSPR